MFDLLDPKTFWLNITNIGLGIVTLACLIVVGRALLQDVAERFKARSHEAVEAGDHAFLHPELGLTMADGGEKLKEEDRQ